MPIRSFRVNFRTRGGIDTEIWNSFWRDLELDLTEFSPRSYYLGSSGVVSDYDIAVSGIAGKETLPSE